MIERIRKSPKCFIIAEAADAHYGDMGRAKQMISAAKSAGADAIKFQHHIPDAEMLPEIPMSSNMHEPLYEFLMKNALSVEQHGELQEECLKQGITYLCTPFSIQAAEELESFLQPLPLYKIGSGEMLDFPTISRIAGFGKPLVVSTGMSELEEVDEAYRFLCSLDVNFALLNCVSAYPPRAEELRIGFTAEMAIRYPRATVGFSDHTNSIYSSIAAIAVGAKIVEKHVTADPNLKGPDAPSSITFEQLAELVSAADMLAVGMSRTREVTESEREIREWARRSLVYQVDVRKGQFLEQGMIWGKRPGTGVPARNLERYLGRQLARDVSSNTLLQEDDFVQ